MSVTIKKIWYNPAEAAFEGRVDICRNGRTFRYPCAVPGPLSMSPSDVKSQMMRQAGNMSDTNASVFSHL